MEYNINKGLISILKPYKNNKEFIAKIIVLNSSGILLGCKPACTITFSCQNPQKNTLFLWNEYKDSMFKNTRLKYMELFKSSSHNLVLFYDESRLKVLFEDHELKMFLYSLGYNMDSTVEEILYELKKRFINSFPHEIGVFVGLPLKDVMGFMGINGLKLACRKGWNIYGDIESSICIWQQYEICRNTVIKMLMNNRDPFEILKAYPGNQADSFCHSYVYEERFTATRGSSV